MWVIGLVSQDLDRFKGSMTTTSAPGAGSLRHVHKNFPSAINNVRPDPVGKWRQPRLALAAAVVMVVLPSVTYLYRCKNKTITPMVLARENTP
jgi:hypothetical protein